MSYRVTSISAMFVCIHRVVRWYHGWRAVRAVCPGAAFEDAVTPSTPAPAATAIAADVERNSRRVGLCMLASACGANREHGQMQPRSHGGTETHGAPWHPGTADFRLKAEARRVWHLWHPGSQT